MNTTPTIRPETPYDLPAIRHVNENAFGRPDEAYIVDSLRQRGVVCLSLVALHGEQIVGHILFSPVIIKSEISSVEAVALGPMAVLPSHQRKGIGAQLVRAGLQACKQASQSIVIVLGHPEFYSHFGFKPSRPFGICWERDVPPEVFMVAELRAGALDGISGVVKYQPEFGD